jgi:putative transposase
MVVGFALSFNAPKAGEVLAALRHAILPKTYTERWVGTSLRMVWEAMGIPDEIIIDNGLDLQAHAFYSACLTLGTSVTTTPPMEPWRKGRAERPFGTLNTKLLHRLPGSTFGKTDNTKKYEYNPKDFACVTLDELLEALHITIEDMACTYHKGIDDVPIRRWREGARRFPLRMPMNLEEFNAQVSLRETRVIGRLGIEYKGLYYADDKLVALRRTLGKTPSVTVLIKPEDIREVYVVDPATQTTVAVSCTQQFDVPLPLFLHEERRKNKTDSAKDRTDDSAGAKDAQDSLGTNPADKDFRADALQRIEKAGRARLPSIVADKSTDSAAQITAMNLRTQMEAPRSSPDHKAASALIGRSILNMTEPDVGKSNANAPGRDDNS